MRVAACSAITPLKNLLSISFQITCSIAPGGFGRVASYPEGVERSNKIDRASALVSAAAHDFNEELTIICSSLADSISTLEPGHPARALLMEARGAAQRCAWKAAGLLNYMARAGIRPIRRSLESLLASLR